MLKLMNIKKSFSNRAILNGVTCEVRNEKLVVLEGQNGAGKSSLFSIIVGLLEHDEGTITLNDINLGAMSALERSGFVAILKQDPKSSTCASLSIEDNFALALLKNRIPTFRRAVDDNVKQLIVRHLRCLGLAYENDLERPMASLSGGQRQLLAFAMATINKPDLLLLDEPTAALDDESAHLLMKLIKQFVTEWQIPAFMISHDHELNRIYADEIYTLKDGML